MNTEAKRKTPKVIPEHIFLNIARDFCRPLDSLREAISNAIDFHATEIYVKVSVDKQMPGEELVIEIADNGDGMDERRLEAFFNLGDSSHISEKGEKIDTAVGEKGHGTKTYYNSRQIEVFTCVDAAIKLYALMDQPLIHLLHKQLPDYDYDGHPGYPIDKGTKIIIKGFNNNVKRDFAHRVLKDHILWLTKFADFSWVFEDQKPKILEDSKTYASGPKLFLHGLGYEELGYEGDWEEIRYGHVFPAECTRQVELGAKDPNEPMRWYVKRWVKKGLPVKEEPGVPKTAIGIASQL